MGSPPGRERMGKDGTGGLKMFDTTKSTLIITVPLKVSRFRGIAYFQTRPYRMWTMWYVV